MMHCQFCVASHGGAKKSLKIRIVFHRCDTSPVLFISVEGYSP